MSEHDDEFSESDVPLSAVEKVFLLHAERGDCATVTRIINEYANNPREFNINCVDPLNRSALVAAIENENIDLIKLLLKEKVEVKDALLHAIKEEYVEAVEILLEWEEHNKTPGQVYSWEATNKNFSTFTPDITPLILAAHMDNYEILKLLLDRGATLPVPHDIKCDCDDCVELRKADSVRHSQSRINAYRALISSSLIALSSKDPILTAFELSKELRRLSHMETEFRTEYIDMQLQIQTFSTALLNYVRNSQELEIILNFDPSSEQVWNPGEIQSLGRLKLAVKNQEKNFVAHANVQQLLAEIWYAAVPGFRRKNMVMQFVQLIKLMMMSPMYSLIYVVAPNSKIGQFISTPFVKFVFHCASYSLFLGFLSLASQRVEYLILEWIGTEWTLEVLAEWNRKERGTFFGLAECVVILYVISLIWAEIKAIWNDGLEEYICDLWNIVDFITNVCYVAWISLRLCSWYIVRRENLQGRFPWYPREEWQLFDPMLLSEGAFAAGMIFSFLKLVHIFSVSPHLGPLQISLGRMIIDIIKFFFIYTLVLFAFGCGLNQLLWYYSALEKQKCYLPNGVPDFDNNEKACSIWRRYSNRFETFQSLFWASFGLIDLVSFELAGIKGFTRFWAMLMFGSYSVINIIVLLNLFIAMMSNSYQIISERSDVEWKFARSCLWLNYFDDEDVLAPPFNLIPTVSSFSEIFGFNAEKQTKSFKHKSKTKDRERHEKVMHMLIKRYITAKQQARSDSNITEDDVMEIRQDVSSLRYELINILRTNGMKTPVVSQQDTQVTGKKDKLMERLILNDFWIGAIDTPDGSNTKDIFTQITNALKRGSHKRSKGEWNNLARKQTMKDNPIGSSQRALSMKRRQEAVRSCILENDSSLLAYNPNLANVSATTRAAYGKFMKKKTTEFKQSTTTVVLETETEHHAPTKPKDENPIDSKSPLPSLLKKRSVPEAGTEPRTPAKPENDNPMDGKSSLPSSLKKKSVLETVTESSTSSKPEDENPMDDKSSSPSPPRKRLVTLETKAEISPPPKPGPSNKKSAKPWF